MAILAMNERGQVCPPSAFALSSVRIERDTTKTFRWLETGVPGHRLSDSHAARATMPGEPGTRSQPWFTIWECASPPASGSRAIPDP